MVGNDLLKKIIVYTLLMKKTISEKDLFPYLMETIWYKETVDFYFDSAYETKYDEIMNTCIERGGVLREKGSFVTTVKP